MTTKYPNISIWLEQNKKAYFASDFHFGAYKDKNIAKEKVLVAWLDEIKSETGVLFLVGDLFDFWFEYKHVVPKGTVRFLSKISEFVDKDIPVYVFTGNHDIWMFDYLEKEIGVKILRHPAVFDIQGKKFFVGHGDGLGPGDNKFKFLKKIFTSPVLQWMFKWVHPDIGIGIAQAWSNHSRTRPEDERFMGEEKERLVTYSKRQLEIYHAQYFVFGHRHLPLSIDIGQGATYFNLGDWIVNNTYLEFDGTVVELKKYR
ncbi:MAG: UDP-2,3-diacylglucosamine diphosphatase [Chitinophagales bacterium]|nr:UDP-2,3-diacylglucosamine diphosphatase [Chitinophagales bacterium]